MSCVYNIKQKTLLERNGFFQPATFKNQSLVLIDFFSSSNIKTDEAKVKQLPNYVKNYIEL